MTIDTRKCSSKSNMRNVDESSIHSLFLRCMLARGSLSVSRENQREEIDLTYIKVHLADQTQAHTRKFMNEN